MLREDKDAFSLYTTHWDSNGSAHGSSRLNKFKIQESHKKGQYRSGPT